MEQTQSRKRYPLISYSILILVILLAIYFPLRLTLERSGIRAGTPASGTAISIFVTSELAGYREPCT
jgi:hypothetical protein